MRKAKASCRLTGRTGARPQRIACRTRRRARAAIGAVLDVLFQDAPLGFHDAIVEECREHPLNLQAIHIAPNSLSPPAGA